MASELDWFPCEPGPLLGSLAGMKAPKKLTYLILILRIYECGGGCPDTIDAIAVRVGLNKRVVSEALDELFREGRLVRASDGIRNPKADMVIAESMVRLKRRKAASTDAANSRWQKAKGNQQNGDAIGNADAMQNDAHRQIQEQDSLFSNENRVPVRKARTPKPKPVEPVDDGWPADYLEQFWTIFPPYRREAKAKLGEKLERIRREAQVPWLTILGGAQRYAATLPGEFACAPMVWLNQGRWDRVYGTNQPGGNHATNRPGAARTFAVLAAELRHGTGAAPAPDAGGLEPPDRYRNPA